MAFEGLTQILRRTSPTLVGASSSIEFDCSIQEDHGVQVALTERPIEAVPGQPSILSDHAVVQPRSLTMVVRVSNIPDKVIPFQFTRHLRIWRQLRDIAKRVELVDIVTTLEVYLNMVLLSVSTPRRKDTTNCLEITVTAREAQFTAVDVSSEMADAVSEVASGAADLGAQGTQAQAVADLATMGVV